MHRAELLVLEPSFFAFEVATETLKRYKSPYISNSGRTGQLRR
jgi:hypothetical protein